MTANQINYQKNLETERHDRAMEELSQKELSEAIRSNKARESLQHEANQLNYQGSVYSSDMAYASSVYKTRTDRTTNTLNRLSNRQISMRELAQNKQNIQLNRERLERVDVPTMQIKGVQAVGDVFSNLVNSGLKFAGIFGL